MPQITKSLHGIGKQEIKGPQPQHGEDIGGIDNKSILRYGENRRNRIHGKENIRYFDREKYQ